MLSKVFISMLDFYTNNNIVCVFMRGGFLGSELLYNSVCHNEVMSVLKGPFILGLHNFSKGG